MRQWRCWACDFIDHEERGLPEAGIAPGTQFRAIADDG